MAFDPVKAAARWRQNLTSSATAQKITDGVGDVKKAPTQTLKERKDKVLKGLQEAMQPGKAFDKGCDRVTLGDWQGAMINEGIPALQAIGQRQENAMASYLQQAAPDLNALSAKIKAMPKNTIADSKARAMTAIDGMAALKGKYRGKKS